MPAASLLSKKCVPCEGGVPPATDDEIAVLLQQTPGWEVRPMHHGDVVVKTLQRRHAFADFRSAMAFLRTVEDLAEREGHHPDFCVQYNRVNFTLWTHAINGLHENDFVLAAKINAILAGSS